MNTNARGRLLEGFLAKIVTFKSIFSANSLCEGWHGFLQSQGSLDQKLAKIQPFMRGLALIPKKIENFGENVTQRACLKK